MRQPSRLRSALASLCLSALLGAAPASAAVAVAPGSSVSSSGAFSVLTSPNGAYVLTMQGDGNLVLTHYGQPVWNSATWGQGTAPYHAALAADGSLHAVDVSGKSLWTSGVPAGATGPFQVTVQSNGNLVVYDAHGAEAWSTKAAASAGDVAWVPPRATVSSSDTFSGLVSPSLAYSLKLQADGTLVQFKGSTVIWTGGTPNAGTAPYAARMQNDGNLVVYDAHGTPTWATATYGQGVAPYSFSLNDYGNAVIHDSVGTRVWSSLGTAGTSLTGAAWAPPPPSRIFNAFSARCFDAAMSTGGSPHLWDCDPHNVLQGWLYTLGNELQLATNAGQCLTYGGGVAYATMHPCDGSTAQRWLFDAADGAVGMVHPFQDSTFCLDASGVGTANGTPIITYACHNQPNQQWTKTATGSGAYDPSLPVWPPGYSDAGTNAAQQAAFLSMSQALTKAVAAGASSFTIPPGIYRTNGQQIALAGAQNFTIYAAGVEILAETANTLFTCGNVKNLTIRGPLVFDSTLGPASQSKVLSFDPNAATVDVQVMPGYATPPTDGSAYRFLVFDPNGTMVRIGEADISKVEDLGGGKFRVHSGVVSKGDATTYAAGNFMMVTGGSSPIFIDVNGTVGLTLADITLYGGQFGQSPIWGMKGDIRLSRIKDPRRPGTNRLIAACTGLFGDFLGGSLAVEESEQAWSIDDINDPFNSLSHTTANAQVGTAPNQFNIAFWDQWPVGFRVNVYNNNAEPIYSGTIVAEAPSVGGEVTLTMDSPVGVIPADCTVDSPTAQATRMTFDDTYAHDGQSTAFQGRGHLVHITNTYSTRNVNSISAGADSFRWNEGGISEKIVISNNTINYANYYQGWPPGGLLIAMGGRNNPYPTGKCFPLAYVENNLMTNYQWGYASVGFKVLNVQELHMDNNVAQ